MCSEALREVGHNFGVGYQGELSVALHLRGRILLAFFKEWVNGLHTQMTFFLGNLDPDSLQRLTARIIHYEASRAKRREDKGLIGQLLELPKNAFFLSRTDWTTSESAPTS
jgi:hypothetical protein